MARERCPLAFGKTGSGLFQVIPRLGAAANGGLSADGAPVPTTRFSCARRTASAAPAGILDRDDSVARGLSPPYFRDVRFGGARERLYTMRLPSSSDGLVRTIRPLTEANSTIAGVRWLLLGLTLGGALVGGSARTAGRECRASPRACARRDGARGERDA